MNIAYPVEAPDNHAPLMAMTGDFDANLDELSRLGYDRVELLVRDPAALAKTDYLACLARHGMAVAALSTAPMEKADGCTLLDPRREAETLDRLLALTEVAQLFHCPLLIGKVRGRVGAQTLDRLGELLASLCQAARERQVTVLLEPQSSGSINNLNTIAQADALIAAVGARNLGLHLDAYHMALAEADPAAAIREARAPVGFVHLSDSDRRLPGQGTIDLPAMLAALAGYTGYFSPEVRQEPDSLTVARRFAAWAAR